MYESIREKLRTNTDKYYYTECTYSVSCLVYDTYIEKEVTNTRKIRSYEPDCHIENFCISSFTSKTIAGLQACEIKSIEVEGHKLAEKDYTVTRDERLCNLDEQNEYDSIIKYALNEKFKLSATNDITIKIRYIARTTNDDRVSSFRVEYPCKNFSLFYNAKQHDKYRLMVDAYGFFDDADDSPNNQANSNITIKFADWIFKHDGASVVLLDK